MNKETQSQTSETQTGVQATNHDDIVSDSQTVTDSETLGLGDTQTTQASQTQTADQATNHDDIVGDTQMETGSETLGLGDTETSQASKIQASNQATNQDDFVGDSQTVTDGESLGLSEMSGKLAFDWEKVIQKSKAFEIPPNSEPNSPTDQKLAADRYEQFEAAFMVPEPSVSGIAESTTGLKIPKPRSISEVDENYIFDDMSSLTDVSDIKVSNAPRKHEYGKERVERKGNVYDKLYNSSLKGELSIVKDILDNHSTTLMPDENGQTSLYAACIGDHREIVKVLIDFGHDVNHQDNEGKTPLHITFENHAPDLAQTLITEFKADTEIRENRNGHLCTQLLTEAITAIPKNSQ